MTSWDEKRQHQRAYLRLNVECRGKSFWQYVETKDLSAGGMFIATEKVEPPKTKVEILFECGTGSEKKLIQAEGVVAWSRGKPFKDDKGEAQPAGMGIMFTKITPSSGKDYIDQWIKKTGETKNG